MILPMRLFRSKDMAAIAAHDDLNLEFCIEVAKEIFPIFGEGRRITDLHAITRAATGWARPLSNALRHVDLKDNSVRRKKVKSMLLTGAADIAMDRPAFLPGALDLVTNSGFILAYPGALDLYSMLRDIYIWPSLRGDAAAFARVVGNMDGYWTDTQEGICRAQLLGEMENRSTRTKTEEDYMESLRHPPQYYNSKAVHLWQDYVREEGDKSPSWNNLAGYWEAARSHVKFPETKE